MCGRFALAASAEELHQCFGVDVARHLPRYNIAPSQQVLIVAATEEGIRAKQSIWGIRRRDGGLLINIRSETACQKPHFRRLLDRGRCIVPASGFYEWSQQHRRQPFFVVAEGMPLIGFAGVVLSEFDTASGVAINRCAILTRAADGDLAALHHRVPVVVPHDLLDNWLTTDAHAEDVLAMLLTASPPRWRFYPVSHRVGRVSNDDRSLIEPLESPEPPLL